MHYVGVRVLQTCPHLTHTAGTHILVPFGIATQIPLSAAFLPAITVSS